MSDPIRTVATGEQAERRAQVTREIMQRTQVDEALIEQVVRTFYSRVQRDALLGPVFAARVENWDDHIERLCAFWSSVALMTGRYHGQPMRKHLPLPISAGHFERWLALFEATANELCPPAAAAHLIERARRIADSLEMGIAAQAGRITSPRFGI